MDILRKDDGYIGKRVLRMELPGKRKRGRPKRRFMDVVKEDIAEVEVTEEDAEDSHICYLSGGKVTLLHLITLYLIYHQQRQIIHVIIISTSW